MRVGEGLPPPPFFPPLFFPRPVGGGERKGGGKGREKDRKKERGERKGEGGVLSLHACTSFNTTFNTARK